MKPIEYCLDRVLIELKRSWENTARPPLDSEQLLTEFEVPLGRHEFFKSIVLKLVNDGYAHFLVREIPTVTDPLDWFTKRVMLTADGLYFISAGAYQQKKISRDAQNTRLDAVEAYQRAQARTLTRLTGWIAGGTIALALIELIKMAIEYHWFAFRL